ncbi:MAG: isopentenyl-diphosphate Delta-isomerase [Bacteroidota bacterium]|nr:isopentenyl-diphosphate Delta-isomerase [Bacteroidota bacterium]
MSETNNMHALVILVNEADEAIGTATKVDAHKLGLLHRAFSIMIYDYQGNILMQQRAASKYHSPLLWTNACCSHPTTELDIEEFAMLRLNEEMGLQLPVHFAFTFLYRAELDGNMVEHELDHVYVAEWRGEGISPNPDEVADYAWMSTIDIAVDIQQNPEKYTAWFQLLFPKFIEYVQKN